MIISSSASASACLKQSRYYKNMVKNDRKIFEIPALLSSQQGNPGRENSKYLYFFEFSRSPDPVLWISSFTR